MQGLKVRFAKNLNKLWGRKGRVFADRYYARELKSLREIRNALVYVLRNAPHHGIHVEGIDEYTSGPWFDGWERPPSRAPDRSSPVTCVPPKGWPLRIGWKLHYGLIGFDELPRSTRDAERHTCPVPARVR